MFEAWFLLIMLADRCSLRSRPFSFFFFVLFSSFSVQNDACWWMKFGSHHSRRCSNKHRTTNFAVTGTTRWISSTLDDDDDENDEWLMNCFGVVVWPLNSSNSRSRIIINPSNWQNRKSIDCNHQKSHALARPSKDNGKLKNSSNSSIRNRVANKASNLLRKHRRRRRGCFWAKRIHPSPWTTSAPNDGGGGHLSHCLRTRTSSSPGLVYWNQLTFQKRKTHWWLAIINAIRVARLLRINQNGERAWMDGSMDEW